MKWVTFLSLLFFMVASPMVTTHLSANSSQYILTRHDGDWDGWRGDNWWWGRHHRHHDWHHDRGHHNGHHNGHHHGGHHDGGHHGGDHHGGKHH